MKQFKTLYIKNNLENIKKLESLSFLKKDKINCLNPSYIEIQVYNAIFYKIYDIFNEEEIVKIIIKDGDKLMEEKSIKKKKIKKEKKEVKNNVSISENKCCFENLKSLLRDKTRTNWIICPKCKKYSSISYVVENDKDIGFIILIDDKHYIIKKEKLSQNEVIVEDYSLSFHREIKKNPSWLFYRPFDNKKKFEQAKEELSL